MRSRITKIVESKAFERFILAVIILNTIVLGLETSREIMASSGHLLEIANIVFITIFVIEMVLKLIAWRGAYFKSGWNIFDFSIVVISLIPTSGMFSGARILRILRILRSLRMISAIKPLRKIVQAVLSSIPAIGWTGLLMLLLYYIYAVMGIHLYRDIAPDQFAGFPEAFVTLFSLTTMEGWQDVVFPFTDLNPLNWIYFITFLIIASFVLLNLVVGIVVDNISEMSRMDEEEAQAKSPHADLHAEIEKLRAQLSHVQEMLDKVGEDVRVHGEDVRSDDAGVRVQVPGEDGRSDDAGGAREPVPGEDERPSDEGTQPSSKSERVGSPKP